MTRPRATTLVGLVLVAGALLAIVFAGLTNALVYYVTPTELLAKGDRTGPIRLYGIVDPGSVGWDESTATLSFRLTDGSSSIAVVSTALPTGLFRDGIGVVVAGQLMDSGSFVAEEVLVKHSEVYAPLEQGQTPPPELLERLRSAPP